MKKVFANWVVIYALKIILFSRFVKERKASSACHFRSAAIEIAVSFIYLFLFKNTTSREGKAGGKTVE